MRTSIDDLCTLLNLRPYRGRPYSVINGHIEHNGKPIPLNACISQAESYIQGQQTALDNLKKALTLIKRRII